MANLGSESSQAEVQLQPADADAAAAGGYMWEKMEERARQLDLQV